MAVLAGQPWPLRAAAVSLAAATVLGAATGLALCIALAGLGRLNADMQLARLPAWLWHYRGDPELRRWLLIGGGVAAGVLGGILIAILRPKPKPLHGDARFATAGEVARAGLRDTDGVILGQKDGALLRSNGREHIFICAPTGSGKSSGIIIPTLQSFVGGSAVVLDIKRECWEATAGWRQAMGQDVWLFEPFAAEGRTARFNPLGHIDRKNEEQTYDVLQRVATILFPDSGGSEGFWNSAARDAFMGVALLVAQTPDKALTLGEIAARFAQADVAETLSEQIASRSREGQPLSKACVLALTGFCETSPNTFSSIRVTVTTRLQAWFNARVDAATSQSDFDLKSLRAVPSTLYLCVAPGDLARAAPIFSLLVELLLDQLGRTTARPEDRRLLMLLDEFAALGRLSSIARSFAWIGGYGVRLVCVVQNRSQLHQIYGEGAEEIIGNCGLQVYFAPNALSDARQVSDLMGTHDQVAVSQSRPAGLAGGRRSESRSRQRRNLMMPQELLRMERGRLVILARGLPPIAGRWLKAEALRAFKERVWPSPEVAPRSLLRTAARSVSSSAASGSTSARADERTLAKLRARYETERGA
ncbi:type IV secretory system conjugative DNA transfer family protein [Caulobacter segnis]|uniref:type IV secretory system conjugative DNA transfer family protein n=1 Tax=Caulobacter segnis TaxID=88688 RepID=UPI00240FF4EF|nr:type IV secretory system conjugative DNA transfer family protein [Caulobacter segnis]MDG2520505.1 type IV secretory system conjugative DNA transfer family protein [Caulobacter segnis]